MDSYETVVKRYIDIYGFKYRVDAFVFDHVDDIELEELREERRFFKRLKEAEKFLEYCREYYNDNESVLVSIAIISLESKGEKESNAVKGQYANASALGNP